MKDFLAKTIKLWLSIVCFALAVGMYFLLSDFFSNGKGFIRLKGLIAPIAFAVAGVYLCCSFIKTSFKSGNRYYGIVAILIVILIGGGAWYFSSDIYQNKRTYNLIVSDKMTNEDALAAISVLLKEDNEKATEIAIKCLEHLHAKGVKDATFNLGEIYFEDKYGVQDYSKALNYLEKSREAYEVSEASDEFRVIMPYNLTKSYEYLGDIYGNGLAGEVEKEKALKYYQLSLNGQLEVNSWSIENKIEALLQDSVSNHNNE